MSAALQEACAGNTERARQEVDAGLKRRSPRDVRILAAVILAWIGDSQRATSISDGLHKEFPLNTTLNLYWLPVIESLVALHANHAERSLKLLETAAPLDLAYPAPQYSENGQMFPPFVRGQAYLALHQGKEAAAEFQKFIDHRTIAANSPLAALARLGLARAYAQQNDDAKSRAAYQDFFAQWKDADPDIPILKQAKSEYAKLP
jgi:predicted Zn-dependent protease